MHDLYGFKHSSLDTWLFFRKKTQDFQKVLILLWFSEKPPHWFPYWLFYLVFFPVLIERRAPFFLHPHWNLLSFVFLVIASEWGEMEHQSSFNSYVSCGWGSWIHFNIFVEHLYFFFPAVCSSPLAQLLVDTWGRGWFLLYNFFSSSYILDSISSSEVWKTK